MKGCSVRGFASFWFLAFLAGCDVGSTSAPPRPPGSGGGPDEIDDPAFRDAVAPADPGAHDVLFTIDSTRGRHPISAYVYGTNQGDLTAQAKGLTLTRVGGNRLTAYNWETNASNAGSDYKYQNDTYISGSKNAGEPMKKAASDAAAAGASIIMTVPMAGWVAADVNGPCDAHPANASVIGQRFVPVLAAKGSPFAYPPDTSDSQVFADEFVAWLESEFPGAQTDTSRRIFYMLDNEPDLWAKTHSEIHPDPATYEELAMRSAEYAAAIKTVAPDTLIFGPASYGWAGYLDLQKAPDAKGRDFLEFYLDSMKAAEKTAGKRLIDVLDVHWYPEARGDGKRITDTGTTEGEVAARLQAPRSLWDTTYTETSWITQSTGNTPIRLIPRLMKKIADHYPGTKLSVSEYNYGAGGDISGGIAQADVLGIFGRDGVFAANVWLMGGQSDFLFAGFAMYRNIDGNGAAFGDTSISASTSAVEQSSVYASIAAGDSNNVIAIAINKQPQPLTAGIAVRHTTSLSAADVYTLTSASPTPVKAEGITAVSMNAFSYTMPAYSVSTLIFRP